MQPLTPAIVASTLLFGAAAATAQEQVVLIDPVSVYGSGYYTQCPDFTAHHVFNVARNPALPVRRPITTGFARSTSPGVAHSSLDCSEVAARA